MTNKTKNRNRSAPGAFGPRAKLWRGRRPISSFEKKLRALKEQA